MYIQSIGIIQAPDIQPNGQADMCDSCPDITIYDGKFINSCRMDEYRLFGGFVAIVDKDKSDASQKIDPGNRHPKMTPVDFLRSLWKILAGRPQVPPALAGNPLVTDDYEPAQCAPI